MTIPSPLDGEFAGRRVVVTGAGSGMGLAAVRLLVERGASVVGVARSDGSLRALDAVGARALRSDVTRAADRADMDRQVGTIDCLVIAHGETTGQRIDSVTQDDWDRLMASNLGGFVTW